MCTVTFMARRQGYCLGMNRDEKLTRATGRPPRKKKVSGRMVISPSEPAGGTWISLNDQKITFVLINWYAITATVESGAVSRGEVVNTLAAFTSPEGAGDALAMMPLQRINPFRLIGIFPERETVIEWRWDRKKLARLRHPWKTRQWISSGHDEAGAQRVRGRVFRAAQKKSSAHTLAWLRRLHRSHAPERGPFSTCMHRADAATVSYTEILVSPRRAVMRHHAGAPCGNIAWASCELGSSRNGVEAK